MIAGVAILALGMAGAYLYKTYSLYQHFNSDPLGEVQSRSLTKINHETGNFFAEYLQLESPQLFSSAKNSNLDQKELSINQERLFSEHHPNSLGSLFWSLEVEPSSFQTNTFFYSIGGTEMPFYDEAIKINLHKFYEMSQQEKEAVIEKFQLHSSMELLGKESFLKKLAEIDKHILELANLVDIKYYNKESGLKYIILNNAEFNAITLDELKDISLHQKRLIIERLKDTKKLTKENKIENVLQMPLVRFLSLPGQTINQDIAKIPANIFFFNN